MGTGKDKKKEKAKPLLLPEKEKDRRRHAPGRVALHGVESSSSLLLVEEEIAGPYPDSPEREIGTIVIGYHDNSKLPSRVQEGLHPSPLYHDSLTEIGAPEGYAMGYEVQKGWGSRSGEVWLRDIQIVLADGSLLFPWAMDDYLDGKKRGECLVCSPQFDMELCVKALLAPDGYVRCEEHLDFNSVPLKVFFTLELVRHAQEAAVRAGHPCWKGKTCIEGGNILVAARTDGSTGAIIGEASLIQSLLAVEAQLLFDPTVVTLREKDLVGEVHKYRYLLKRLEDAAYPEGVASDLFLAVLGAPVQKFGTFTATDEHLLRYLAKLDITKDYIAADLGLHRKCLTFVEQPAFHLDMAMAVGPKGCVLLQSYAHSRDFLKRVLRLEDDFDPRSEKQRKKNIHVGVDAPRVITPKNVKHYYTAACRLAIKLADVENRIREQLVADGYTVVRAAGVFAEQANRLVTKDSSMPINFFNNVSGSKRVSSSERQMFYITNGTGCSDDNLGDVFRTHWWENVCEPLGYQMVFFIANLGGMAQASLATSGGLRCLTTVLPPRLGGRRRVFKRTLSKSSSRELIRSKSSDSLSDEGNKDF